jgi:hypothetical protein
LNLQQDNEEPYDACPYCLTEIVVEEASVEPVYDEPETVEQNEIEELEEAAEEAELEVEEETPRVEEPVAASDAPSDCPHYLGYLSEKSSNQQIPDECMMCKDIVTCMLKKMKE